MMLNSGAKNLLLTILLGTSPFIYAAESHPLLLKMDDINYSIEQIKQNNPLYEKSYKNLMAKADKALKNHCTPSWIKASWPPVVINTTITASHLIGGQIQARKTVCLIYVRMGKQILRPTVMPPIKSA